jgi:CRISPR-associated protein Cas1
MKEANDMSVLYVTQQGATVGIYDGRAVVRKARETISDIPALKIDQIVLFGKVNLTPAMVVGY